MSIGAASRFGFRRDHSLGIGGRHLQESITSLLHRGTINRRIQALAMTGEALQRQPGVTGRRARPPATIGFLHGLETIQRLHHCGLDAVIAAIAADSGQTCGCGSSGDEARRQQFQIQDTALRRGGCCGCRCRDCTTRLHLPPQGRSIGDVFSAQIRDGQIEFQPILPAHFDRACRDIHASHLSLDLLAGQVGPGVHLRSDRNRCNGENDQAEQ